MKSPNFFIIGAPRCGTTSLAAWLVEHPDVYVPPIKEPNFFCTDLNIRVVCTQKDYESLFKLAKQEIAVGEASAFYLFSGTAVPKIETEYPQAKYIVMVRNPIEMAQSWHTELVYKGWEHVRSFEAAWRLSPERRRGRQVRPWCREPKCLDYQSICRLGEQIERLYKIVPKERVLVVVLDDMARNPRHEYLRVLDFLGVPDDGRTEFPRHNPSKKLRFTILKKIILALGVASRTAKRRLGIPEHKGTGILKAIDRINFGPLTQYQPRPPLSKEFRKELIDYYGPDVEKLGRLLNQDLSGWLQMEV